MMRADRKYAVEGIPRIEKSRLHLRLLVTRQTHTPGPRRWLCCASRSQHQNPKRPHQSKPHVPDIYPLHRKTSYPAQNHTPLPCFDAPLSHGKNVDIPPGTPLKTYVYRDIWLPPAKLM